jgi:hypothetical protein
MAGRKGNTHRRRMYNLVIDLEVIHSPHWKGIRGKQRTYRNDQDCQQPSCSQPQMEPYRARHFSNLIDGNGV